MVLFLSDVDTKAGLEAAPFYPLCYFLVSLKSIQVLYRYHIISFSPILSTYWRYSQLFYYLNICAETMGSQTDDGDNGSKNYPNWEADMLDSTQIPELNSREQDDENTLSPASKKLLEKCAVSMPPPPNNLPLKIGPSVISRPTGTELDFAGFSFAKPTQPTSNFTCRSRAAPSSEEPQIASCEKDRDATGQKLRGNQTGRPR